MVKAMLITAALIGIVVWAIWAVVKLVMSTRKELRQDAREDAALERDLAKGDETASKFQSEETST